MAKLSARTDPWLAELERYSVPFGITWKSKWISSPPEAWDHVFNGPHDHSGKPINRGGLTPAITKQMINRGIKQQTNGDSRRMPAAPESAHHRMTSHSMPTLLPTLPAIDSATDAEGTPC